MKRHTVIAVALTLAAAGHVLAGPAKNVIVAIGDGMGWKQVEAAACYAGTNMSFESFPRNAAATTESAGGGTTDSAAGATAIATGNKVNNAVISVALPGDGSALPTLLEYMKARGKRTGLVSTTAITDATPAAFGAHATNRSEATTISEQYLYTTRPNVLFGPTGGIITPENAAAVGYTVLSNAADLATVNTETSVWVSGQFGAGSMPYEYDGLGTLPHLSDMTDKALKILDNEPAGFFLMVESAKIDHACHATDIVRCVHEVMEFSKTVSVITNWAVGRTDTLVIITADHETGGLAVTADNGMSNYPSVTWNGGSHTTSHVPVYAWGPGSEYVTNIIDNTNHFAPVKAAVQEPAAGTSGTATGSNSIHMTWSGISGAVYALEYKANLFAPAWSNMLTLTSVSPTFILSDTNISADKYRYYRLRSVP